ncbi:IS66-like element accessory protein TnpA [Cereibacter azotoformans]|uniref:IS66-like element accessory protein TnpA n=1 Tax=Cereibacter azotoformans TaxID=43057 RepID=UPI000C6E4BFB|nr:transposase [Cereibacter azotoformans]
MRHEVLLGAERRRRWSDDEKLAILAEVARNGWTVSDVARRHDLTRQHIYQWRRELRRKLLWPRLETATFLPVEMDTAESEATAPGTGSSDITVVLRNGRQIRCGSGIGETDLARLIRLVEAA